MTDRAVTIAVAALALAAAAVVGGIDEHTTLTIIQRAPTPTPTPTTDTTTTTTVPLVRIGADYRPDTAWGVLSPTQQQTICEHVTAGAADFAAYQLALTADLPNIPEVIGPLTDFVRLQCGG